MMVFALMASTVNAHGITDVTPVAAHDQSHSHNGHRAADDTLHQTSSGAQHTLAEADTVASAEAHHLDTCSHSHCSNHVAGVMAAHSTYLVTGAMTVVPTSGASWASSGITDNIERPKLQPATPAVVSLLS